MKQYRNILPLAAAMLVAACGSDSALPNPTGKASVRAINAIQASPTVDFRIEERSIGTIGYREVSAGNRFDDFSYRFNFDIVFAGDSEVTRIASESIDFVADQDYTLLLSGTIAAPNITVWETSEREFDAAATVFQARFSHTADSLTGTTVDVYFALDGTAPVAGEQVATVAFGDISAPMDFEAGDYVYTMTTAGDVNDVLYQSGRVSIGSASNFIITPFDGTANDTAPVVVRLLSAAGSEVELGNSASPALLQFLHAAPDLGSVDVYDDENLMSLVVDDLDYQVLTPEQIPSQVDVTYSFTPFDDTGTVYDDRLITAINGNRYRMVLTGIAGEYTAILELPDRRSVDSAVRLPTTSYSQNFDFLSIHAMEPGVVPDADSPVIGVVGSLLGAAPLSVATGSYDLYVSDPAAETFTLLAGPFAIDVTNGDVREYIAFDNASDPAIIDFIEIIEAP